MEATIPEWAQSAGALAIVLIATFTGIINYFKTKESAVDDSDKVVLKDILHAIKELHDDSIREIKRVERQLDGIQDSFYRGHDTQRETNRLLENVKF